METRNTTAANDDAGTVSIRRVLALSSSPRRCGNSHAVAAAVLEGAAAAGHHAELVHLADHVQGLLRNCRDCRRSDGSCAIEDGYRDLFLNKVLSAEALVIATPIWWYGMSGHLKNFFDRLFCYFALSYPDHQAVQRALHGKRIALVLSAEENNLSARLGILQSVQELCRYLHWSLVGLVTGIGNSTGEVVDDPSAPLAHARDLGRRLFDIVETDYKADTVRSPRVWSDANGAYPTTWR
jgi:multimeric flavodoxin WrbA